MRPFLQPIFTELEAVDRCIIKQLHSDVPLVENIGQYIVEGGGKRLRPTLVILIAKALGYKGEQHIELATIIEFIHTATLLHDDVIDLSKMRRGRATVNQMWGNSPSVLVGDFLYSRAFQMMVYLNDMKIMSILANTTNTIAEGEVMQLANAHKTDVTEEGYMSVIHKKTAALFEAACESAAKLSGASDIEGNSTKQIGYHLGLAFQLVDDALDYSGDPDILGKNVGDDLAEGKVTLPLMHAREQGSEIERKLIDQALSENSESLLTEVIDIVSRYQGLDYTYKRAHEHVEQAKLLIHELPPSEYREALNKLGEFAVERDS